jgi:GDP-mannose 6-dehydrogenase
MRMGVFGLGYVGCVSAACLSQNGHEVLGLDISPQKVGLISSGRAPVIEPGLDSLVREARALQPIPAAACSRRYCPWPIAQTI